MMYTAASFFSGIGGIDIAFSLVGFDIRVQVEVDAYCRNVLWKNRKYWQNARQLKDIKNVTKAEVGEVDVMFGGFPCQDISIAGKRAGITRETRSGLWFEFLRLIRQVRPKVVVLENVAAIHVPTTDDNGYQQPSPAAIVTATLTEVGYDCIWLPIRASDIGAPHQRERWFCIAYRVVNSGRRRQYRASSSRTSTRYQKRHFESRQRTQKSCETESTGKVLQFRGRAPKKVSSRRLFVQRRKASMGQELAHSESKRPRKAGQLRRRKPTQRVSGTSSQMGNAASKRFQGQGWHTAQFSTKTNRNRKASQSFYATGYNSRAPKPRLGRITYGIPCRMDRHQGQFPARPNEQQYDYEPSRVTGRKDQRRDRLKALGNAVVPQQVLPIAMAVKAFLEGKG